MLPVIQYIMYTMFNEGFIIYPIPYSVYHTLLNDLPQQTVVLPLTDGLLVKQWRERLDPLHHLTLLGTSGELLLCRVYGMYHVSSSLRHSLKLAQRRAASGDPNFYNNLPKGLDPLKEAQMCGGGALSRTCHGRVEAAGGGCSGPSRGPHHEEGGSDKLSTSPTE